MKGEMLLHDWDLSINDIISCHEDITLSYKWKRPNRSTGEICYLMLGLEGRTLFSTNKGPFSIGKGDILFLPENLVYIGSCTEIPARCIMIRFTINKSIGFQEPFLLFPKRIEKYQELFTRMIELFRIKEYGHKFEIKAILYTLIHNILNELMVENAETYGYKRIKDAIVYIHENYTSSDMRISDAAAAAHLSEVQFRRIFNAVFDTSPLLYITNLRMKKAQELLAHTDYTIEQISCMVGIFDQAYFAKFFKKHQGLTPNEFRKMQQ